MGVAFVFRIEQVDSPQGVKMGRGEAEVGSQKSDVGGRKSEGREGIEI